MNNQYSGSEMIAIIEGEFTWASSNLPSVKKWSFVRESHEMAVNWILVFETSLLSTSFQPPTPQHGLFELVAINPAEFIMAISGISLFNLRQQISSKQLTSVLGVCVLGPAWTSLDHPSRTTSVQISQVVPKTLYKVCEHGKIRLEYRASLPHAITI